MNLQSILAELKKERDRIDRAIAVLGETDKPSGLARKGRATGTKRGTNHQPKKGHLTAAGRKRLSEMMKKRWAERRRKGSNGRKATAKAV
jgi:hypothetical protein